LYFTPVPFVLRTFASNKEQTLVDFPLLSWLKSKSMNVVINGEPLDIPDGLTVQGLMPHLNLKAERIAVERNQELVRRADWATTFLQEGDKLEIVHFVGGGVG
jgi:thiamine biosynthesis protein ThiS